jgi:hypothetical protein
VTKKKSFFIRLTPESQVAEVVHALGVQLDVHLLLEEVPLLPLGLKLFPFFVKLRLHKRFRLVVNLAKTRLN